MLDHADYVAPRHLATRATVDHVRDRDQERNLFALKVVLPVEVPGMVTFRPLDHVPCAVHRTKSAGNP